MIPVASHLIFVYFLGCVSVCARARMVITAFLVHLFPLFTVIALAQFQFLFTRSVCLFPGSSLRHSLFFASSPFSCGEPRAFLCYSVFCYARARQEFAFEFHLRNFHLFWFIIYSVCTIVFLLFTLF